MKPLPTIPDTPQPDLILVLMHSGWGPACAAQFLWQHTQSQTFQPVERTNIGLEKISVFNKTFNLLTTHSFVGRYSYDTDIGKLLAWVTICSDWREQLRQQVAEALQTSNAPQHILVVDEPIHEGSTAILTLGLLNFVYPQSSIRFVDADCWFHSTYLDFMLAKLLPADELSPGGEVPMDAVRTYLEQVAIGSEVTSEVSLLWQSISTNSPSVQALTIYRPSADWVAMSQAINANIAMYIRERAATYIPNEPNPQDYEFVLRSDWLMMRDIWSEPGITRRQAEQRYRFSGQEVKQILEKWIDFDDILMEGYGRGAHYLISAPLQRYINKLEVPPSDYHEAYWLLPGRLMIGVCPSYHDNPNDDKWTRTAMRELLERSVDFWLDVQIVQKNGTPQKHPLLGEKAKAVGREVFALVIPLTIRYTSKENNIRTRRGRPNRKDIRSILYQIDLLLADAHILYVSLSDQALCGILAGCYLARHGQSGYAALLALQARWATGINGWKREPASRKARRYVRSWLAGLWAKVTNGLPAELTTDPRSAV